MLGCKKELEEDFAKRLTKTDSRMEQITTELLLTKQTFKVSQAKMFQSVQQLVETQEGK